MRAACERGLQVINRGLAGVAIERGHFEENAGSRRTQPLAYVLPGLQGRGSTSTVCAGIGTQQRPDGARIGVNGQRQQLLRVEAAGIGEPADAARGYTGDAPIDGVLRS